MLNVTGNVILSRFTHEQLNKKDGGVFDKYQMIGSVVTGWQKGASALPVCVDVPKTVVDQLGPLSNIQPGTHLHVKGFARGNEWQGKVYMSIQANQIAVIPGAHAQPVQQQPVQQFQPPVGAPAGQYVAQPLQPVTGQDLDGIPF